MADNLIFHSCKDYFINFLHSMNLNSNTFSESFKISMPNGKSNSNTNRKSNNQQLKLNTSINRIINLSYHPQWVSLKQMGTKPANAPVEASVWRAIRMGIRRRLITRRRRIRRRHIRSIRHWQWDDNTPGLMSMDI